METLLQQLTRGNALLLIAALGIGGSFQSGYYITAPGSPSPFIRRFINSSWYSRYQEHPPAQTVTMIWSLVVSMYAVGGLFGAISVKMISERLGRKKAMICNSSVAIVAAVIMVTSKVANSYEMIIVARVLYGFSSGAGSSIHLMYLTEISPRKIRGIVTMSSVTFRSLGKLFGQFCGLSEILGREELWNIVLCVSTFFSVVNIIMLPFFPEAPRYLFIEKGDDKACKKALQSLWGQGDYKQEMDDMLIEQAAIDAAPPKTPLQLLRDKTVRWQLISMSFIGVFNQLSGMAIISTFSFDIFLKAGIPSDKIRYITLGLGVAEIITAVSCGLLIDQIGRRPLFWGPYGVMSLSWVMITVILNLKDSSYWAPYVTAGLIILFIMCFCGGPGGVSSTLNGEIFIQSDRMASFVLMGVQQWVVFAALSLIFPFLINALGAYCFLLFACVCLMGCLYTFFVLPETKGKTLLDIAEEFKAITLCGKTLVEKKREETRL